MAVSVPVAKSSGVSEKGENQDQENGRIGASGKTTNAITMIARRITPSMIVIAICT